MANFITVVDPDEERRTRFMLAAQMELPFLDGLATDNCTVGAFATAWAASPRAPISSTVDANGAGVLWGEAIAEDSAKRYDATDLRARWQQAGTDTPEPFDGFHAAITYDVHEGLTVGADLLGLFPVYYYASKDIILVGSSPDLFRLHPKFRAVFNPSGLVGMLLLMHIFDGETLLQDVRRLAPGHLLRWQTDAPVREMHQYSFPASDRYYDRSFDEHLEMADDALKTAVARHAPPDRNHAQLFSGGLDSRMMGGYLRGQGSVVDALTLGQPADIERTIATRAVHELGFRHRTAQLPYQGYVDYAEAAAQWEHVCSGLNEVRAWGMQPHLQTLPPFLVSGYLMGSVVGSPTALQYDASAISFEEMFATSCNSWGLSRSSLERLLRVDAFGKNATDATIERIHKHFIRSAETDFSRNWHFDLGQRQRFHIGGNLWRLSFGSWPVLPFVDRNVLRLFGGLPLATIAYRRLQEQLLRMRFPDLAAVPLDRNAHYTRPLQPGMVRRAGYSVYDRLPGTARYLTRRLHQRLTGKPADSVEQRYYFRVYDINNNGWRAVRRRVEPMRTRMYDLFDEQTFNELLPPPEVDMQLASGIRDASGLKTLMGFMLWAERYL